MGWDAIVFGELTFKPGSVEDWKELVIEEERWDDWPGLIGHGAGPETSTVEAMLAKLKDYDSHARKQAGPDFLQLTLDGNRFVLRGWINEDDYRAWSGSMAAIFRVAEEVGAQGHYLAMACDDMEATRLVVSAKGCHFDEVGIDAAEAFGGDGAAEGSLEAVVSEIMRISSEKPSMKKMLGAMAKPAMKAPKKKAPKKKATPKKTPKKKTR